MEQCHQNRPNLTTVTRWHHAPKQNTTRSMKTFKWWCNGTSSWLQTEWAGAEITHCQFPFRLIPTATRTCFKLVPKWRIRILVLDLQAPKLTQVRLLLSLRSPRHSLQLHLSSLLVYPSGGMLEMSNGYPSSPLGPSPSPSPVLGGHHNSKCKSGTNNINLCFLIISLAWFNNLTYK